ncbi:transcriptional regulator GcvA [Azospirillum sp. RWY-5-1]|uniref:Transcriptional regulator GcvA n=1 Tax=Azospirillum oleiclasticum TaxID=2735135 RepID=A0ABX2TIP8_9PROT|nr:transcriptional regulator GcvA [Azospirillum oleiclasticum]NYZ17086.1 transcriptional regulator GcvA [Azospirillum oleiclasticum]NYZ24224.1 transcriptional regulator GcvA [Azospirillum oleiclasticum]
MAFRLPPLHTLRLFEAAARHLSFKLAADELCVTPSAVSHGIRALEEWLGAELFLRGSRGLRLSEVGTAYLREVRHALEVLAAASDGVRRRSARGHVRISVAPTFAGRWLLPALPAFKERYPEVAVSIDTSHRVVEFPRDGVDLGIRLATGPWPGLVAVPLLRERLVPVCAPALAARIRRVEDLTAVPLLHVSSASEDWQWWLGEAGHPELTAPAALVFDEIRLAMDAAVRGMGVAIGRRPTIDPELEDGRLVEALPISVPARSHYWLVGGAGALERPELRAFCGWLEGLFAEPA